MENDDILFAVIPKEWFSEYGHFRMVPQKRARDYILAVLNFMSFEPYKVPEKDSKLWKQWLPQYERVRNASTRNRKKVKQRNNVSDANNVPSIDEVDAYIREKGYTSLSGARFIAVQQQKNKGFINWRDGVDAWEAYSKQKEEREQNKPSAFDDREERKQKLIQTFPHLFKR